MSFLKGLMDDRTGPGNLKITRSCQTWNTGDNRKFHLVPCDYFFPLALLLGHWFSVIALLKFLAPSQQYITLIRLLGLLQGGFRHSGGGLDSSECDIVYLHLAVCTARNDL